MGVNGIVQNNVFLLSPFYPGMKPYEYILICNVPFPFGVEFSRVGLVRLFEANGIDVEECLLDVKAGRGVICVKDPVMVHNAIIILSGVVFFGRQLIITVGSTPCSSSDGFTVTLYPTPQLIVQNFSFLKVLIVVRKLYGVRSVIPLTQRSCLIFTESVESAKQLRQWILNVLLPVSASVAFVK